MPGWNSDARIKPVHDLEERSQQSSKPAESMYPQGTKHHSWMLVQWVSRLSLQRWVEGCSGSRR